MAVAPMGTCCAALVRAATARQAATERATTLAWNARPARPAPPRTPCRSSSGLPRRELEEAAGRGELVLGGCLVSFDAPDRACVNCGHEWQTGELPAWFRTRFADS